jgi:hypothetical protein
MNNDLLTSVVRILDEKESTIGTGFVISDLGIVVTCAHVIQATSRHQGQTKFEQEVVLAFPATGEMRSAKILPGSWRSPTSGDIAILAVERGLPKGIQPLRLAVSEGCEGRPFSTIGFSKPNPEGGMLGKGEILGRTIINGFNALQIKSQEVTAGFSGAPILDILTDCVIGMVSSIVIVDEFGKQRETAFAIPSESIHEVCPSGIELLPGEISGEKLSKYLIPLAINISKLLEGPISAKSVQGGVPFDHSEVVYMTPSNHENEIPYVRVFEPLQPVNNLLFQKLRLDGIVATFIVWLTFLLLYTGGIFLFRSFMHTPLPGNLSGIFHIAGGLSFYYPDWNSIAFDTILNPILAALACALPILVAKRLTILFHSGLLEYQPGSKRKLPVIAPWQIFSIALLLAIATVIGAWFNRYRFYQNDPLSFRFYVLFLVGLSTYVRWSLLILALQTVSWIIRCEFKPTNEFLSLGRAGTIYPLGELSILLFITFYVLLEYAIVTIGTSIVKKVPLGSDSLFWEAAIQIGLSLVGVGLVYIATVYRPQLILLQAKDDFIKSQIMKINDLQERQAWLDSIREVPTLLVWESAKRQAVLLVPFILYTLLPFILWGLGKAA